MTALAPASFSISAEMSPVWAPEGFAWQSWPPMRTGEPDAASANSRISVAGGQIMTSKRSPAPAGRPRISASSSDAEALSPFIFQLPATSGFGAPAIDPSTGGLLAERPGAAKNAAGPAVARLATAMPHPYDARPSSGQEFHARVDA